MPLWGLSALAAGSISASLSDSGQAEVSPRAAPVSANDALSQRDIGPSMMTLSVQPRALRNSWRATTKATDLRGMSNEFMQNGQLANLAGHGRSLANAVVGTTAVTAPVSVAAVKTVIDLPAPMTGVDRQAIGIVDVLQVTPTKATSIMMAAASVVLPKISSDAPAAGSEQARNRSIYGTSANNAYKVYFPHAEHPVPAQGVDLAETSVTSAEQDARVLKKHGSYLFYEDQAEQPGTGKINEILKANGASTDKAVVDAIANVGKNAEPRELTAPVLQKQPLNFGDRSLEGASPKGNAAPAKLSGESNAG
jgi:hypothetical protein